MSATMISQHIPDLDLITSYAEHQVSFFSRVSPWTKLGGLVLVILLITITRNLAICSVLYIAILAMYYLAGLPVKKLLHGTPCPSSLSCRWSGFWRGASPGLRSFPLWFPVSQSRLLIMGFCWWSPCSSRP